jgi:hypothetical protein
MVPPGREPIQQQKDSSRQQKDEKNMTDHHSRVRGLQCQIGKTVKKYIMKIDAMDKHQPRWPSD